MRGDTLQVTGAVDEEQSDLFLQQARDQSRIPMRYPGLALFSTLENIPGIAVTRKITGGKLQYALAVQGVKNKEFSGTFRCWVDNHRASLEFRRPRSRIISDGWLLHRRYTKAEYRAVVDAIRIFDRVLTEFKDKFESDRYPNPILVYAEAGMDMDHDVFHARRGGRFKPERVFAGAYGPMSEEEKKRRVDETLRVFIGWEGISLKIIYDRLFRPIARLQPLALFIHELMHHVETVRGIPHSIESHTDEKLLELARKELATSYIPDIYAHSLELRKFSVEWLRTVPGSEAWGRLASRVNETATRIEALLGVKRYQQWW